MEVSITPRRSALTPSRCPWPIAIDPLAEAPRYARLMTDTGKELKRAPLHGCNKHLPWLTLTLGLGGGPAWEKITSFWPRSSTFLR